jgi:hypothetical protein
MSKELKLLNLVCVVTALFFLGFIIFNAITAPDVRDLLSTDNLFVTVICLLMAVLFAVNPLLYLKSEGKLPIPFLSKQSATTPQLSGTQRAPLLDARGRAVPPDVRAIVSQMGQAKNKV